MSGPVSIIAAHMPDEAIALAWHDLEAIHGEVCIGDDSSMSTRPAEYRHAKDCHSAALGLASAWSERKSVTFRQAEKQLGDMARRIHAERHRSAA